MKIANKLQVERKFLAKYAYLLLTLGQTLEAISISENRTITIFVKNPDDAKTAMKQTTKAKFKKFCRYRIVFAPLESWHFEQQFVSAQKFISALFSREASFVGASSPENGVITVYFTNNYDGKNFPDNVMGYKLIQQQHSGFTTLSAKANTTIQPDEQPLPGALQEAIGEMIIETAVHYQPVKPQEQPTKTMPPLWKRFMGWLGLGRVASFFA